MKFIKKYLFSLLIILCIELVFIIVLSLGIDFINWRVPTIPNFISEPDWFGIRTLILCSLLGALLFSLILFEDLK